MNGVIKETPSFPLSRTHSPVHFDHMRTQNVHSLKPGRIFLQNLRLCWNSDFRFPTSRTVEATVLFARQPVCSTLFLLVLSHFHHVGLFVTPWTIADQAPLPMEFSRQEYWSGFPCPPSGGMPSPPGIEPTSPESPALQADSLLLSHQL